MMHLFLVKLPELDAFAHLHPVQSDSLVFTGQVPGVPAGKYRLFGDLTLENGLSVTVTNTVELPAMKGAVAPSDSDDAHSLTPVGTRIGSDAVAHLGDGYSIAWIGGSAPLPAAQPIDLH